MLSDQTVMKNLLRIRDYFREEAKKILDEKSKLDSDSSSFVSQESYLQGQITALTDASVKLEDELINVPSWEVLEVS